MGLDMYLHRKTYVKQWEHQKPEERFSVTVLRGGLDYQGIDPKKVSYVVEEVGYWRKANQIHKWFVENCQDGNDDCREHYVSREKLSELLDLVNRVLSASKLVDSVVQNGSTFHDGIETPNFETGKIIENPTIAKELLPTQSGFFFGGTDYDQWYMEDLENTKKIIEPLVNSETEGDYYYESSW